MSANTSEMILKYTSGEIHQIFYYKFDGFKYIFELYSHSSNDKLIISCVNEETFEEFEYTGSNGQISPQINIRNMSAKTFYNILEILLLQNLDHYYDYNNYYNVIIEHGKYIELIQKNPIPEFAEIYKISFTPKELSETYILNKKVEKLLKENIISKEKITNLEKELEKFKKNTESDINDLESDIKQIKGYIIKLINLTKIDKFDKN